MRPIEFRYRFRNRQTDEIITQHCTIENVENRPYYPNPFGSLDWEILSRDQFIGIRDKNEKKIWEGDVIVLPGYNQNSEVLFRQGMFCAEEDGSFFPLSQFYSTVEVIGNIYENPELLEKKP